MVKSVRNIMIPALLLLLPSVVSAQQDSLGVLDTLYAEVAKIDSVNWSVTFSYFNDEDIVGLSIPFKINAGINRIVADSAVFSDRVEGWDYKVFRVDTAIQCVTVGLIANISTEHKKMSPGFGKIVTVYVSSVENKPIEKLAVDTTTTHPSNSMMTVAEMLQGDPPDTVRISPMAMKVYPAFVVRQAEAAEPKAEKEKIAEE